jgi:hypothetical protein
MYVCSVLVESAIPFPLVGVKRVADAPRDRAGVNIAVIDVPAVGPLRIPASGEGWACRIEAQSRQIEKSRSSTASVPIAPQSGLCGHNTAGGF